MSRYLSLIIKNGYFPLTFLIHHRNLRKSLFYFQLFYCNISNEYHVKKDLSKWSINNRTLKGFLLLVQEQWIIRIFNTAYKLLTRILSSYHQYTLFLFTLMLCFIWILLWLFWHQHLHLTVSLTCPYTCVFPLLTFSSPV